jgi:hypothetical protein
VTGTDLFTELARQGFTLTAEGVGIRVRPASRLTDALRAGIRENKAELLARLAADKPWDQAAAANLVAEVEAARGERFGAPEWPADPSACRELGERFDSVDRAWLSRDRAALESAVRDTLALIARLASPEPPSPSSEAGNPVPKAQGGLFAAEVESGPYRQGL